MLLLTVGVLEDRPDIADQVRAQYRHFVVDEYQDVNPLQQRLLELWLGGRRRTCAWSATPSQTIYSFTGATPDYLLGFRAPAPGRHGRQAGPRLPLHPAGRRPGQRAARRRPAGRPPRHRLELVSQRAAGPEPVYTEYPDEPAEAEGAARRIKDADRLRACRPSEIAVLFRINAQSEVYEQALADAGVPVPAARRRAVLRAARGARGGAAAARRRPRRPTTRCRTPATIPQQVRAVLSSRGWAVASRRPAPGAVRDRWESLAALVAAGRGLRRGPARAADLGDFVAELDERATAQHAPTVEGVTLASLHAAKGLEWDAVFLVGLTEGTLPITYAKTDEQVEEERRLLYVGVTRARLHLSLSWALSRSPGGRGGRRPSRFLDGLRPGLRRPGPGRAARAARAAWSGGCGRQPQRAARCCAGCAGAPCPRRARSS